MLCICVAVGGIKTTDTTYVLQHFIYIQSKCWSIDNVAKACALCDYRLAKDYDKLLVGNVDGENDYTLANIESTY